MEIVAICSLLEKYQSLYGNDPCFINLGNLYGKWSGDDFILAFNRLLYF